MIVNKPWGSYEILTERRGYTVKIITVNPGAKLSLQYHENRDEFWFILDGFAHILLESTYRKLHWNDTITIPKGTPHQVSNLHPLPLVFLEIQQGKCEECDIIRLQDKYGRVDRVLALMKFMTQNRERSK